MTSSTHQDLEDDTKAGIKSLAVLYGDSTRSLLWQLLALTTALLITCGILSKVGIMYYLVTVSSAMVSLGPGPPCRAAAERAGQLEFSCAGGSSCSRSLVHTVCMCGSYEGALRSPELRPRSG